MSDEVDIVVTGFDVDARQAEAGLVRLFGLDGADARRFLQELPTIAKRGASPSTAKRYVEALQSIGARVDCVPAKPGERGGMALGEPPVSLPAPPSSMMQELHRSMRVDRATEEAIDRFRESEGMPSRPPSDRPVAPDRVMSFGPDPMNPRIPQAPRLPNMDGMPNALPSAHDSLPAWRTGTAPSDGEGVKTFQSSLPGDDGRTTSSISDRAFQSGRVPITDQSRATGATQHSHGVAQPSSDSIRAMQRVGQAQREERSRRRRAIAGLALGAVTIATVVAFWLTREDSELDQLRLRIEAAGIQAGNVTPAHAWLEDATRTVRGLGAADAQSLVSDLSRAGASAILAVRIDGEAAGALVVVLPKESDARRTVLWQVARAQGREPSLDDDQGQRFVELKF
ncbi:MAG: hypothetical protein OXT09_34010 [Myxococcales bacterium]|nr:hypothetical protein [Myxococcales bacterium]